MSLFTIFLIAIAIVVAITIIILNILNSRVFRIWFITKKQIQIEREEKERYNQERDLKIDDIKNPNELEEILKKIKLGEEVEIPILAFQFIYKNINKFSVIDKQGRVIILENRDYFEFKKRAEQLLVKGENKQLDAEEIVKEIENQEQKNPFEIEEHEDGTIIRKDNVNNFIEIISPDGSKVFIDQNNNKMVTEKVVPKENKEEGKKEENKDYKTREENKKLKQKNLLLEEKIRQEKNKNKEAEEAEDEATKSKENNSKKNELEGEIKEEQKREDFEDEEDIDGIDFLVETENNNLIETENNNVIGEVKENEQKETKEEETINTLRTLNFDTSVSLNTLIKHSYVKDILLNCLSYDTQVSKLGVVYNHKTEGILVNVNYFSFVFTKLFLDHEAKELFLDNYYIDKERKKVNNDFLTELIKSFNFATKLRFHSKILYQEKTENSCINFKSYKTKDTNGTIYSNIYLYVFLNNEFGREFKKGNIFNQICKNGIEVVDTNERGKKLYLSYFDILPVGENEVI